MRCRSGKARWRTKMESARAANRRHQRVAPLTDRASMDKDERERGSVCAINVVGYSCLIGRSCAPCNKGIAQRGHIPSSVSGTEFVAEAYKSPTLSPMDLMANHEWIERFVNLLRKSLS